MTVERLCELAAFLISSRAMHLVMQRPPTLNRECVGIGGGLFKFCYCGYVHVVSWPEVLRLLAQLDFIEVQRKLLSATQPCIVGEQGSRPVIGMRIDGPMREDDIGFLVQ